MANSRIYFKSEAGGTTVVSRGTTATSGNFDRLVKEVQDELIAKRAEAREFIRGNS